MSVGEFYSMGDPHGIDYTRDHSDMRPYVFHDGEKRFLSALPPRKDFLPKARAFAEAAVAYPLIPRKDWATVSYARYVVPVMNQHQEQSCTGHGTIGAFTKAWLMGGGTPHTFSAEYPYANCNGGRDAGANGTEVADSLHTRGVCLASEVPEGMIFRNQFPASADITAQRFRAEVFRASTWDELVSGLLYGFIPCFGIYVGRNFSKLDRRGVAPVGYAQANHWMYADGLTILSDGTPAIDDLNSWGMYFGDAGRCYLIEAHVPDGSEICLIKPPKEDPQETDEPPVVA